MKCIMTVDVDPIPPPLVTPLILPVLAAYSTPQPGHLPQVSPYTSCKSLAMLRAATFNVFICRQVVEGEFLGVTPCSWS